MNKSSVLKEPKFIVVMTFLAALLVYVTAFAAYAPRYTAKKTLDGFTTAIEQNDTELLQKYAVSAITQKSITSDEADAFIALMKSDSRLNFEHFINIYKKSFLGFEKYYIEISAQDISLYSNLANATITIGDKTLQTKGEYQTITAKMLFGVHNITATVLDVLGNTIEYTGQVIANGKNASHNVFFDFDSFYAVKGDYENPTFFVNEKQVAPTAEDERGYDFYPIKGKVTLEIVAEVGGAQKSYKTSFSADGYDSYTRVEPVF